MVNGLVVADSSDDMPLVIPIPGPQGVAGPADPKGDTGR